MAWLSRDDGSTERLAYLQDWESSTDREIEELELSIAMLQRTVGSTRERLDLIRRLAQVVADELEFSEGPIEPSPEVDVDPALVIDVSATRPVTVTLPASRPGMEADGQIEQIVE